MAKHLNVDLSFNANTAQAKQSILDLQKTLQQIATQPININDKSIQQSVEAAKQLTYHLNAAFNTSTGKLDLTAFNASLKRSNTNVTTLSSNLLQSGQIGQQAFIQLAQAVSQAEYPMLRVNRRLTEMWTTMKNTARWQLSSSILHGFIGAVQKAHGYAQDLNESLNNIRIVTGYSVEDMADFAEEANKAAKALRTTTTEYTNASLIYYQQGLNKEQVLERADVTVKLANVSRQSAEMVSDQMTAVWNNFYDGSQSLEYYADVMTALGATTASSTDEIAGGLEKFAAVADTIGLSYEYAASALATITSNTRQSEEVVGTALKTIFARIQGLNLGETLEDGTTLNKYSEALEKVGISIFDSTGELKKMDNILDEMGSKWQTLAKDQQVALAQTVAGVRQYNQLVSLMDNWDSGDADSMQANLETSYNASGALQEQADIYAESWEAASKKVQTSLEGIYQALLDDEFFIGFNNGLADVLSGVEHFIESIGGVKGVVSSVGTFLLSMLAGKIEPAIRNTIQNITVLFTGARGQVQKFVQDMSQINEQQIATGKYNTAQQQSLINARQLTAARQQLSIASKNMSEQEACMAEFTLQGLTVQQDQAQAVAESIVQLENQRTTLLETAAAVDLNTEAQRTYSSTLRILASEQSAARMAYMQDDGTDIDNKINAYHRAREATEFYQSAQNELKYTLEMSTNAILDNYKAIDAQEDNMASASSQVIAPFTSQIADLGRQLQSNTTAFGSETETLMVYADALLLIQKSMPPLISQNEEVKKAFNAAFDARKPQDFIKILSTLVLKLNNTKFSANQLKLILKSLDGKKFLDLEQNADALSKKQKELLNIQKQLNAAFGQFNPTHTVTGLERVATSAAALGQVSMMITSLRSAFNALSKDSDMSFGERITTILMSISMFVPSVIGAFKNLGKAIQGTTLETQLYTLSMKAQKMSMDEINATLALKTALQKGEAGTEAALAAVKTLVIAALKKEGIELNATAKAQLDKLIADELAQGSDLKTAITKALVTLRTRTNKQAVQGETAAKVANKIATDALNISLKSLLGWIALIIAAITIVVSVYQNWKQKQEELIAAREEDAAAARESIQSLKEETESIKELYNAYLNAKGALDTSQSSKDSLRKATEELCKALGVEWDALDKLQGKYEDVNKEILKTELGSLEKAAKEAQESKNKNEATYRDAVSNVGDFGFRNEGYSKDRDGNLELILPGGVSSTDEKAVREALNKWIASEGLSNQLTSLWYDPSGSLIEEDEYHLTTDGSLSKEQLAEYMYQFYEHLYSGNAGISNDVLDGSEIAQWFKDLGKKMKDEREGVQEAEDYLNELIPQIAEKRAQLSLPGLLENIETEEDYEKYRAQYIQTLEEAYKEFGKEVPQDLATVADNYFAQYDFLKPVVETSQYLEGIREKLKANGETDAAIEEFITHLKENNLVEVVAQVITDNSTIDSLNSSMNAIQKLADSKQLIIRWNILPTAKSDLKDNMTTEEYQTWLNKYSKDLFGESGMLGGMSAETFSSLSYTQQQNALTNAYDYTNMDQVYDNAIASQQTLLDNEKNNVPELKQISVNQAAANKGIYNIDSDILWYFKQFGDLEKKKNSFNSQDIVAQQADMLKNLATMRGLTLEEMMQQLLPITEQYGSILSISKTISDEYNTQNELLKNEYADAMSIHNTTIQTYEKNIADLQAEQKLVAQSQLTNRFESASSLGDIYAARDFGIDNEVDINYDVYAEALTRVASAYGNCADEMARYQTILRQSKEENSTITEDQIAQAQANLEASIAVGELAKAHNLNAEAIERYADELASSGKYSKANQKALVGMAKDQLRFDRAVNTTTSNMEDWIKDLEVAKKTGHLVSETAEEMASAYGDLLDIDGSDLSTDFLKNQTNFENLKKALEGDEAAYRALQEAARKDIAVNIGINDEEFQTDFANLMAQCQMGSLPDLEVGASLNNQDFLNGLSEMVNKAGMTAEQATNYLSAMGVDAEVITEPEIVKEVQGYNLVATPGTEQIQYNPGADAGGIATATYPTVTYTPEPVYTEKTVTGTALKVTSASKSSGGGIKHTGSTTANDGSNATKPSGGGSKPKKADKVKKSNAVERYKEINDQLEETQHLMTKTSAEAEGLWGEARFKKMREGVELLKKENQQLKERMKWSKDYVDEDRISLDDAARTAGVSFTYDDDGYITNYTEQMTWLYNQLDNAINSANADGNATEAEQEEIDKWQKYIDDIESARGDYEDALAQWREDEEKWLENRNKIWQDNFDILSEELELKVQLNTQDLEVLQYFLDKIEDAVYGIAEAFASGKYFEQQFANYSANLGLLSNETNDPKTQGFYQNLQDQYRNGDIGLSQYKQGLADMMGMTIENLENLQDLKESMQDFYGDVMEKALEEIAIYTDSMENLNSVLDHYSNILELVGKQDDYVSKNKVLSSKAKNLRNEIDVQKRLYEESAADAEYWAQKMNEAEVGSNEYETYKKNWQAAEAAAQESQDAMLSKTQEWAEAMKSIIENELADFADQLEKSLTGGVSFNELMTSMERRSSLQEEYLTTTNKIYETNKLMRTAQQEIDKTSNTAAKRRMAQFIFETQQLQNKNKLSQYELDIQQAKYDLLLAEIALEEAQDAKSIVRLQRDAEGNFGYVYTADQNAVADAEQQLADAQNNLYNIGLEGANNYQQKYAETLQESQETITELTQMWMNGEISSEEEFNRRKQEIVEYYGEKLQQYSDLHSIALTTDSRVVKDAWSSDFTSMTASVDVWKQNVGTYFSQAGESMKDWADICAQTLEDSGLDDMDQTLGDIDQKSKDLKNTLIGEDGKSGVVAAMMAEVDAAGKLSEEYISIQDAIDGVIAEYEELLKILNEDYQSPNGPGDEEGKQNGNENDGEEENIDDTTTSSDDTATTTLSTGSIVQVKTSASKWANGKTLWGPVKGNKFKVFNINGDKVLLGDPCGPNYTASGITGWINKDNLEGFDTGGYTGEWGSYGKLALLHEKELVLNAEQTQNMLNAMDLLDHILQMIDLQSTSAQLGGILSSPHFSNMNTSALEQSVHIEASFPGVQDRNEIEEAFNNLINKASQYAHRK